MAMTVEDGINAALDVAALVEARSAHFDGLRTGGGRPAADIAAQGPRKSETEGVQPNKGAPYGVILEALLSPMGLPCQAPARPPLALLERPPKPPRRPAAARQASAHAD